MAALLLTMLGPGGVGPGPAFAPGGEEPPPKVKCNAGNGNGNEGCDPGNSAPQNKGGDEINFVGGVPVAPTATSECTPEEGGSTPNPGGNNVPCGA